MDRIADKPSNLKNTVLDAIEIRLPEIYLLRSRANLYNILSSFSLDNGPFAKESEAKGRITFRFIFGDWNKSVVQLLHESRVPFEVIRSFPVTPDQASRKKKVYVAEDDLHILFALNTILEDAGYDVLMSHCGQPMMEPNLPATDLFILENRMSGVDGLAVCRHLRNQNLTKHTPVIIISENGNREEAYEAGADEFLKKPFQVAELLKLVSKHTKHQCALLGVAPERAIAPQVHSRGIALNGANV